MLTFFGDGTLTSMGLFAATGRYSLPDRTHVLIEVRGFLGITGPQVYAFTIEDNTLTLVDPAGNSTAYQRVSKP